MARYLTIGTAITEVGLDRVVSLSSGETALRYRVKMRSLIIASLLVSLASTILGSEVNLTEWSLFKSEHGKVYATAEEEEARIKIFVERKEEIRKHNELYEKGLTTYWMGLNHLSDLVTYSKRGNSGLVDKAIKSGAEVAQWLEQFQVRRYWLGGKSDSMWVRSGLVDGTISSEASVAQWLGASVAERLARSPPTKAIQAPSPAGSPVFRMWESCRTMPLVGGLSRGYPASPAPPFWRCSILTPIALIGSEDLAVKSRPNIFTHSATKAAGLVFKRLAWSPPTKANRARSPAGSLRDFRKCESCRTIPLVGGFSRGSSLHSGAAPYSLRFTLIGCQGLDVKSRPKYLHSFTLRVSERVRGDTHEEIKQRYGGGHLWKPARTVPSSRGVEEEEVESASLPTHVDWRTKNLVTAVKTQGYCGACWAFSTTGAVEGQMAKKTGKLYSYSEQQMIDCTGNMNCANGGWMTIAYQYIINAGGIETEQEYPFTGKDYQTCKFKKNLAKGWVKGIVDLPSGNEQKLAQAVATVGPIAAGMDASASSFDNYAGGIYNEPKCSSTSMDHGVLVVGYGTENGNDYWIVKNSWGPKYGEKGYIRIARNKNNKCALATAANYPTV
ncbi:hypothetical protein PR048_023363 [Dryococelus australis]|uniref:Uncharacterized protein n=1 Tax=Dryococelus australis TaxID=614101 RepID=A0ABQ9GTX8_9NEOP|nr:hypothetical protein PR048_023363 [Dryococelus australis]